MKLSTYPFNYAASVHVRKHGPSGYTKYDLYRPWLRDEFCFRCAYCLSRETWGYTAANWHIDHFLPKKAYSAKALDYNNLIYSCATCNTWKKANLVPDPCVVSFGKLLTVHADGSIEALKTEGAKLIEIFHLDDDDHVHFRRRYIDLARRALAAPDLMEMWMGFPPDLPNLNRKRPPKNSKPKGIDNSYHNQHKEGSLPKTY